MTNKEAGISVVREMMGDEAATAVCFDTKRHPNCRC